MEARRYSVEPAQDGVVVYQSGLFEPCFPVCGAQVARFSRQTEPFGHLFVADGNRKHLLKMVQLRPEALPYSAATEAGGEAAVGLDGPNHRMDKAPGWIPTLRFVAEVPIARSEEHTSELQSLTS